jgi:DNA-binding CsgD family transcriptional regulator/PAS domain-containing protein
MEVDPLRSYGPLTDSDPRSLVPRVYEAAVEPEGWSRFLEDLARRVGGMAPGLTLVDRESQVGDLTVTAGLDPAWLRRYEEYYWQRDLRRPRLQKLPAGSVVAGQELAGDAELVASEFYNDFLRPQHLFHATLAVPFADERRVAMLRVARPPSARPFAASELQLLRVLMPHLRRALEIHTALAGGRRQDRVARAVLERLAEGVVTLDPSGVADPVNPEAERLLVEADGLTRVDGRLRAADPREDDVLQGRIASALRAATDAVGSAGGCLRVSRPSGRRPLALRVTPLPAAGASLGVPEAAALVFVSDPETFLRLDPLPLRELYGLTPAEARVAARIARGRTLPQIAGELGVSPETVRTQRTGAFRKIGVRTQAELAALLAGGSGAGHR